MSRRRSIPPRRRAFVLLDAIIATIVLALALVVIVGLSAQAIAAQAEGRQRAIAAMLIDEQLELLVALGPQAYVSRFGRRGTGPEPYEQFTYDIDISSGSTGRPYEVIATVRWENAGRRRSLSVQTLIAPRLGDDDDPLRKPEQPMGRTS